MGKGVASFDQSSAGIVAFGIAIQHVITGSQDQPLPFFQRQEFHGMQVNQFPFMGSW